MLSQNYLKITFFSWQRFLEIELNNIQLFSWIWQNFLKINFCLNYFPFYKLLPTSRSIRFNFQIYSNDSSSTSTFMTVDLSETTVGFLFPCVLEIRLHWHIWKIAPPSLPLSLDYRMLICKWKLGGVRFLSLCIKQKNSWKGLKR